MNTFWHIYSIHLTKILECLHIPYIFENVYLKEQLEHSWTVVSLIFNYKAVDSYKSWTLTWMHVSHDEGQNDKLRP